MGLAKWKRQTHIRWGKGKTTAMPSSYYTQTLEFSEKSRELTEKLLSRYLQITKMSLNIHCRVVKNVLLFNESSIRVQCLILCCWGVGWGAQTITSVNKTNVFRSTIKNIYIHGSLIGTYVMYRCLNSTNTYTTQLPAVVLCRKDWQNCANTSYTVTGISFLTQQLIPCNSMNSHKVTAFIQYILMEGWVSTSYFHRKQLYFLKGLI